MSLTFTINSISIDAGDVFRFPKTDEAITQGGTNSLIPSELVLELDNVSGTYDDRDATSIFFGTSWYNSDLTIYDDTQDIFIWKGRVKSIDLNAYEKIVSVRSVNLVQDIAETTLSYTASGDTPPAEHIYNILVNEVGIDTSNIELAGFTEAINIQDAAGVYCTVGFLASDDKKCLPVISELCRISQCNLYTENNKLKLKQWQAYAGELGELIENKNLISDSSYIHYFDEKNIVNSYSIKYDNAGTIATTTGNNTTSQASFGIRLFSVPNESMDSTSSADYKILFNDKTAADWAGALAMSRFQSLQKFFEITAGNELDTIKLNDQVDLSFDGMSREPGKIVEKKYNTEEGTIVFKGYYLNTPYQYFARDTTPPEVPEINTAMSLPDGSIILKYTQNFEADFIGYKLYFTSTAGEWNIDDSNQGQSPIDIKNPSTTMDGFNYSIITGLNNGTNYYFKIRSYDSSFNMSADSNIKDATVYVRTENKYMLSGDIITGLYLDDSNAAGGTVVTGLSAYYDSAVFDTNTFTYCSIYQTTFFDSLNLSRISFRGYSDTGIIYYQYDQSNDGSTWDGWSSLASAIGQVSQSLTKKYMRIRFLFDSTLWSDGDYIYITEVI